MFHTLSTRLARPPGRRWHLLPFIALFVIWIIMMWRYFGAEELLALSQDNEFMLAPILAYMSRTILSGDWPLWMPSLMGGVPLYSLSQLSPFYPFYTLFSPTYDGFWSSVWTLHQLILLHLLIASLTAYVLLRTLHIGRAAAIVGAVILTYNANAGAMVGWINIGAPYAWLPLFIAGIVALLENPRSKSGFAMTTVGATLIALASPAQPLIHAVLLTVCLMIARAVHNPTRQGLQQCRQSGMTISMAGMLAVMLSAPVLLPVVSEFPHMIRWLSEFPAIRGTEKIPFEAFLVDQMPPGALLDLLIAKRDRFAIGSPFIGGMVLMLAAIGIANRKKHWLIIPAAVFAAYCLLSAMGSHFGFAYLNYRLPLIDKIREPSRFFVLFQLAIGILAAFGLHALFMARHDRSSAIIPLKTLGAVALLSLIATCALPASTPFAVKTATESATLSAIALLAFAMALTQGRMRATSWLVPVIALVVIYHQSQTSKWRATLLQGSEYATQHLTQLDAALQRLRSLDPAAEYRVAIEAEVQQQPAAMLASYYGIRSFNVYLNPLPFAQWTQMYFHSRNYPRYFQAMGAKFLLCKICRPEFVRDYTHVETVSGYSIWQTDQVLPRLYWGHIRSGETTSWEQFASMSGNIDLRSLPILVSPGQWSEGAKEPPGNGVYCQKTITHNQLNFIALTLDCSIHTMLVLNEFHSKAWWASIDGKRIRPQIVNGNQMGLAIPPGAHTVSFRYMPVSFLVGLVLAMLALIAVVIGVSIVWLRYRERTPAGLITSPSTAGSQVKATAETADAP